ncbi:hypothetical protein B0I37DRAFT_358688 [Chaetomium sp. MPI-CAGE-AT-0009]|nr:hypothetical protein B0I37DRAFT_358688 [Chaetomium sp. MPI-CAGE-AT-0009]
MSTPPMTACTCTEDILGHPEFDLPRARTLALAQNATVLRPSTRKAPEHPFPAILHNAWSILQAGCELAALAGAMRGCRRRTSKFAAWISTRMMDWSINRS